MICHFRSTGALLLLALQDSLDRGHKFCPKSRLSKEAHFGYAADTRRRRFVEGTKSMNAQYNNLSM